jgi:O-antigen ligase
LLVGVALLCLTASQSRGWLRLCAFALIPINLVAIARSGSRAGLIAFAAGLIMMLAYGSAKQRTIILWACVVGSLVAVFLLPANIKVRLTNWLSPTGFNTLITGERSQQFDVDRGVVGATASTESRLYVLRRSLIMTAKHPLLGVGPDQFMGAEAEDAEAHGGRGAWRVPHNTYTEFSSEVGIPGLILFGGALFGSYRGLSPIRKQGPTRHIRQMALFLQTAYFMLMVGAFFLSLGYGGLPFVLIAFSTAFQSAVRRQMRQTPIQIRQPEMSIAV